MYQTRLPSPSRPEELLESQIAHVRRFFEFLRDGERAFLLGGQILQQLDRFLAAEETPPQPEAVQALRHLAARSQEAILLAGATYLLYRPKIGVNRILRLATGEGGFEELTRDDYLRVKDAYVQGEEIADQPGLTLDFAPFFADFPKVPEPTEMGEGILYLNRVLSGQMYQAARFRERLFDFLRHHRLGAIDLLVNDTMRGLGDLADRLESVRTLLAHLEPTTPYSEIAPELSRHGFEAGWGDTAGCIAETLGMLSRLIHTPDPWRFEQLLERIPLIRRVLLVSPHGWFAQEGVLGKPDTGGQVVYVLDQARALERTIREQLRHAGLTLAPQVLILTRQIPASEGTTCHLDREKVQGSENAWIVRVPFRDRAGAAVPHWISRFHLWAYLERYALEAEEVVLREFDGKPDLIVGNYSDGNLVAYLMADRLGATHCALAHALEKSKYIFSDLYWDRMEEDYHFSLQFTADIIAYNSADFIITSSYREIGGSPTEMGMFESYETFSMPGLYRVRSGMDSQLARYNIVPPGADERVFFPRTESDRRDPATIERLERMCLGAEPQAGSLGRLGDTSLPPVFAMSRLDKIKNLPGLVEAFGRSATLRECANLVIIGSLIDASQSHDQEEIEQIERIHRAIAEHNLEGHVRWVGARLTKLETGEVYRVIADRGGVFAQPALMETFGLTVIEAMACGLPVVVTCYGGPAEIVVDNECGRVSDPNDFGPFAEAMHQIVAEPDVWKRFSAAGIERVAAKYSWPVHAAKLLRLANIHAYWNYLDVMNRSALDRYIHTIFFSVFAPRARQLLNAWSG